MIRSKIRPLLIILLVLTFLLPACTKSPVETVPVEPATDVPQGSEGYPWWNDSVFYEIFVRSFYDSNGDGIGDLNGIIEKMDYLNDGNPATTTDLGVSGIWLMPIFPSPSYHGYDTTDYYSVNPDYGTLDDLKRLIAEAHKRGMRVIIDMMLNHTSDQHPWFQAAQDPNSPYHNWYIWSDTDPGYLGPWGEQVWHKSPGDGYYYGVFWSGMPDLNYDNPEVVAKMEDVVRYWLQDVKVDGMRLDGARHIVEQGKEMADTPGNHEFFKKFRTFYKSLNPQALTVGEVWTNSFTVASYVKGDQLDMAFDFDLASAFVKSASSGRADSATSQLFLDQKTFPPGRFATFLTNHDMNRVLSQLGGDMDKAKNAAAMLLTAPGVPFLYYGEEVGMTGSKPDELIRTPMQWSDGENGGFTTGKPWEPVDLSYKQKNVAIESVDSSSLLSFYRTLVQMRNQHVALREGEAYKIDVKAPSVYAILRAGKDEAMLVLLNLGKDPVSNYDLKLSSGPLSGSYQVVPLLGEGTFPALTANNRGGFDAYRPVETLPANARLVLQLQPAEK